MISYFKFTDGDDFTLNGNPYRGVINVIDTDVYTNAIYTSDSRKLSSTGTFVSKCYEQKLNFNFSSGTLLKEQIQQITIQPRAILTVDLLRETLEILARNNARIYASGVRFDNKFLNPLYRSLSAQVYVNTVTSLQTPVLKPVKLPLYRLPLSYAVERSILGFNNVLSDTSTKSSLLLTDGLSGFKYFNNEGVIQGFTNSVSALTFGDGYGVDLNFSHKYLHFNRYTNLLYQTNIHDFCVYDITYTSPTPRVFLQDIIGTSNATETISGFNVSYGRHFRCNNNINDRSMEIYRISDYKQVARIPYSLLNFTSVNCICQRFEDDLLVLVGENGIGQNAFAAFDVEELINFNYKPLSFVTNYLTGIPIVATFAECVDFDSDIIVFKKYNSRGYIEYVEYRSISSPNYPLAKFDSSFENAVRMTDVVNSLYLDLSADYTIMGYTYDRDPNFIDIQHRTSKTINTVILTEKSITADDKSLYTFLLPKQLKQNYIYELDTIRNSSIGLTLNGAIRKLIHDTLAIYYNYCQKFEFSGELPVYTVSILLKELKVDNFLVYNNESINIGTLNRIINAILEIQNTMANELS